MVKGEYLSHIRPDFQLPGAKLVEYTRGDGKQTMVWQRPYEGDPQGLSFEVYAVISDKPGPCVVFLAGEHGDELTPIRLSSEVVQRASKELICGSLFAIPRANQPAVAAGSHTVPGEEDFNRVYHLERTQSVTSARAHTVLTTTQYIYKFGTQRLATEKREPWEISGIILSAHTEDTPGDYPTMPYARIDDVRSDRVLAIGMRASLALGVTPVMEYSPNVFKQAGLIGSSSYVLSETYKIPAISLELGPAGHVSRKFVAVGERMLDNLFNFLGMKEKKLIGPAFLSWPEYRLLEIDDGPVRLTDITCVDSNNRVIRSDLGMFELTVKPGQPISGTGNEVVGILRPWLSLSPDTAVPVYAPKGVAHRVLSLYPQTTYDTQDCTYIGVCAVEDERIREIYQNQRKIYLEWCDQFYD